MDRHNQMLATDLLRISYGHICLDLVVSEEKQRVLEVDGEWPEEEDLDWEKLWETALDLFRDYGFQGVEYTAQMDLG